MYVCARVCVCVPEVVRLVDVLAKALPLSVLVQPYVAVAPLCERVSESERVCVRESECLQE